LQIELNNAKREKIEALTNLLQQQHNNVNNNQIIPPTPSLVAEQRKKYDRKMKELEEEKEIRNKIEIERDEFSVLLAQRERDYAELKHKEAIYEEKLEEKDKKIESLEKQLFEKDLQSHLEKSSNLSSHKKEKENKKRKSDEHLQQQKSIASSSPCRVTRMTLRKRDRNENDSQNITIVKI